MNTKELRGEIIVLLEKICASGESDRLEDIKSELESHVRELEDA